MPSDQLLKLLSAARFPLAVGLFGLILNFGGSNALLKNAGLNISLLATGNAAATIVKRHGQLSEIRHINEQHRRQTAALETSVQSAVNDAATAKQAAQTQAALVEQAKGVTALLQTTIQTLKAERDRMKEEVLSLSQLANTTSAELVACDDDKSILAGQLESLQVERMQLIYELYETAVTEADLSSAIAGMESQFQNDVAYQLTQKKKLKSEVTKARANFHTQITDAEAATAEAQERIAALESALSEKTQLATQMIGDLTTDANGKFTHFSGKANAQTEMIRSLQAQIEEYRKTTKALTYRRFDTVGTDNVMGNRLIDYLAKAGSTYGAFHHEREGHNGRLKVWLTMIDAPLKKANDALEDMEAELKLYARPTVKVDRGMHLFTLATEREYAVPKTYSDNLNRLEKDFDLMNHIRLVGGTGSGKSTFLDNLIWLGKLLWPTADMDLLDPKAPYTKWQGGLTPDFKNLDCVEAIENISVELMERFDEANKIADEFGNDSPEFERYVDSLPYKLFVLDEAQYLYRIARAEDNKQKPKGIRANTVRDSLLDCLGVGRALKVKGYFITQSAKCAKLNMNEDDFDNATSIFLNAAIANALEGELKGAFSSSKIDRVTAEYESRKASGQQYIGLVSHADSDTLYLFQPPQPGYFHQRVLTARSELPPVDALKGRNAETLTAMVVQESGTQGGKQGHHPASPIPDPVVTQPNITLEGKAACTGCGTFSTSIHDGQVNSLGKVKFKCKNTACQKKTFSAVPIVKAETSPNH